MDQKSIADSRQLALYAAELISEKKGQDIYMLAVGQVSIVADYFLLCTGNSSVQVQSICNHLLETLKREGCKALRVEGVREAWWVVLDFGSVVIHVFQPDARTFYDLERLWADAPLVRVDE